MGKRVAAVLTLVVFLFTTLSTAGPNTVQAAAGEPITLYDLDNDSNLTVGETMSSPALVQSGGPAISVIDTYDGTKSLYLQGIANSWDAVDLKHTAFLQANNTYWTGAYTFTVKGHVDEADIPTDMESSPQFILGMSAGTYSWFANQKIDPSGDGTFTLTKTITYTSAYEIDQLGYDYRIQTQDGSPASFYIDDIIVTVVPDADQPEAISAPEPGDPGNTPEAGTTKTLYELDKDSKLTVGGAMTSSPALVKSGGPTISVVDGGDGTVSLYLENRTNDYDGVDLLRTALMQDNVYWSGDYTFTVKGHIAPEDVASDISFKIGMTQSPYGELVKTTAASGGAFTLTYNKNYANSASIAALGYDYRIQTNEAGKSVPFYIDNIIVTVAGTAPNTTTKQLYSFPFDDETAQGSLFTPNSNAEISWADEPGIGYNNSDTALRVTHKSGTSYTGADNAVRLTLPQPLPAGGTYTVSVWVYIPADANAGKGTLVGPGIVLNGDYAGSTGVSKFPANPGMIPVDTWQELNVTLPLSITPVSTIDFRFVVNEQDKHPDMWLFDNIVISQVGDITPVVVPKWDLTLDSLADAYKNAFLIGNVMEPNQTTDTELTAMYKKQYNAVTAENAMKPQNLSSAKDVYNFTEADKIMSWAQANSIQVHGHTLVWHSQSAAWLTTGSDGKALTRQEAKSNMQSYINNVAGHFKGRLISWDVVNEAFTNDVSAAPANWKDALRGASVTGDQSPWYAAYANGADTSIGESGADFIYDAFVLTRLADPNAKLFYNDYNETEAGKREAIAMMAEDLNKKWKSDPQNTDPGRSLIEGIGMQAHYWTADLKVSDVEASIKRFIQAGTDICVSELDIPIGSYQTYKQNKELTAEDESLQADLYKQLFEVYGKYASHIDRVTFWGKADPQSWRSEGYPLLFNDTFAPKAAFDTVMAAASGINTPGEPGDGNGQGNNGNNNNQGGNNNQGSNSPADKEDDSEGDKNDAKDDGKTVQAEVKSLREAAADNKVIAKLIKNTALQGVCAFVTEPISSPKQLEVAVEGAKPGKKVYVYRVNETSGKLETVAYGFTHKVDSEGNVSFPILEGGNYVVLTKKADSSLVTPLREQIKVSETKLIKAGKSSTLKLTLPTSLELTRKLTDKTSTEATGAVVASYKVSDPSVATIDKNGKIVAKKAGKITITTTVKLYNGTVKTFKTILKVTK